MKPLFSIHAGEFLTVDYIERKFRKVNVWIPTKDTGVDILVSDKKNRKAVSLQVKFSRDFLATHMAAVFQEPLRACGWWTLDCHKLASSAADYWVFVLVGFARRSTDFVVIKPSDLSSRLHAIHGGKPKTVQTYLWVTQKKRCWETRGLTRPDQLAIAEGKYKSKKRDFSEYLNNWDPIEELNRK
jgi:hypothetical protein